jgi:IPT/TIG domain
VLSVVAGACLPTRTRRIPPGDDDTQTPPAIVADGGETPGDAPELKPHVVLGVDPPHGPFSGGTLTAIRGNGFASGARVWFGDAEVPSTDVLVLDQQRMQVTSPPGTPGPADVAVQNADDESTRAVLAGGFTYDDFYLDPATGPTAGGTLVTVYAQAPIFDAGTSIDIDQAPCAIQEVTSPTELTCLTPSGTPGTKGVRETDSAGTSIDVLDAFTYVVDSNGFRGGLSGDPLDGQLQVLVLDDSSSNAIPGATVLAGTNAADVLSAQTDGFGTALIASPDLGSKATITIAKTCFQPQTFVDVPVDKLTVFLEPVLSPDCGDSGAIPVGGGTPGQGANVSGELVWPLDGELKMNGFGNIPSPVSDNVKQVAYVFRLGSQPTDKFSLPSAVTAVTPDSIADIGYTFNLSTSPGNFTLYALAGLEDRSQSPYVFTPYAMGLTRGVAVGPNETQSNIYISVDVLLDHELSVDATGPTPTLRGPDRMDANLAIQIGSEGYVLLPNGKLTSLLPPSAPFHFVGIPPLAGALTGQRYVATASAVTGAAEGTPRSSVGLFATVTDDTTLGVGAFIELPQLVSPASSAVWDRASFDLTSVPGGPTPDLTLLDVSSGNGLITWRVIAPGAPDHIEVPDLSSVDPTLALIDGPLAIDVHFATIDDFSYGALTSAELAPQGWRAYAEDVFFATY